MTDHDDHGEHDHGDNDDHGHGADEGLERVTSPMQEYGTREVGIGLVIFAIGLLVTFAVPLALA